MGFRNPFRIQVDRTTSPTSPTTRPTRGRRSSSGPGRHRPDRDRPPAGQLRLAALLPDRPAVLPLELQHVRRRSTARRRSTTCDDPRRGPRTLALELNGGPTVEPGLTTARPITQPEIWYSFQDNNAATPLGTPCFAYYGPDGSPRRPADDLPAALPGALPGRRRSARRRHVRVRPVEPGHDEVPAVLRRRVLLRRVHPRLPARDPARLAEPRLQDQQRPELRRGRHCRRRPAVRMRQPDGPPVRRDGHFYLLTYGDGFFAANPDAGMYRWDYVKGLRAPIAVLSATPTNGQEPLTVAFSSEGSSDPDPGDSISFEWDFDGNGTTDSIDPNPTFTYTTTGQFTAKLTVTDSSGKTGSASTVDHRRQHRADGRPSTSRSRAGRSPSATHPVHRHGQRPGGRPDRLRRVEVTFVLGHDTHGHAEATRPAAPGRCRPTPSDVVARRQRLRRDQRLVHRPRRRRRPGADDDRPEPDPPEAPGGRVRVDQSGTNTAPHRRRRRRAAARQPRQRRLDRAQRPVQPAEHQLDHVPASRAADGARPGRSSSARRDPRRRRRPDPVEPDDHRHGCRHVRQPDVPAHRPGRAHKLYLVFRPSRADRGTTSST